MPSLMRKGGFAACKGKAPLAAVRGSNPSPSGAKPEAKKPDKAKKEKDEVSARNLSRSQDLPFDATRPADGPHALIATQVGVLKDRLAKGHRLNDAELAQLEMAAVARWNQLQREDDEEMERQREAEAEKERQREQRLAKELKDLRSAAAADRANLERAGVAVADELRELRELRDAALRDRASLENSVANELRELRDMRDNAAREAQRRAALSANELAEDQALMSSIYDGEEPQADSLQAARGSPPHRGSAVDVDSELPSALQAPATAMGIMAAREFASREHCNPSACSDAMTAVTATTGTNDGIASYTPPKPRLKKKPAAVKKPPSPLDPATALRMAAFDEYIIEQSRKAERRGDAPPPRALLESGWEELAGPLRQRYEREAALKLQRAGVPVVVNPMGGAPATGAIDEPATGKARVDFGRTPKKPDPSAPPKRKRPPPPMMPAGSVVADALALFALLALLALLVTRTYLCTPPGASFMPEWLPDQLRGGATGKGDGGRRLFEVPQVPDASVVVTDASEALEDAEAALAAATLKAKRAAREYHAALVADLGASCAHMEAWGEAGTGLLHVSALLVAIIVTLTLIGQLWGRAARAIAERSTRVAEDPKQPLLPTAEGEAEVSFAPWSSLACAELFMAAYAATLFADPSSSKQKGGGGLFGADEESHPARATRWLLGSTGSAAHMLVLVCCGMLLLAASRRGVQILWWRRAHHEWLYPPQPKPTAKPVASKVAPADKAPASVTGMARLGRQGGTPLKPGARPKSPPPRRRLFPARCLCWPFGGVELGGSKEESKKGPNGSLPKKAPSMASKRSMV